jgi:2-(1,2-epoxy-1,2-dihydrophenyl)acetyl-CoA isomerase
VDTPPYDLGEVLERYFNPLLVRLMTFPAPLVIAVNGAAAGAGCPLALCADIVVASQRAYFECAFTRLGLIPDLGTNWLLPRLIGRARAHAMMLLNQRVSAEEAQDWGMISQCVAPEELHTAALKLASSLAAMSAPALRATRGAIFESLHGSLADALKREAQIQQGLVTAATSPKGSRLSLRDVRRHSRNLELQDGGRSPKVYGKAARYWSRQSGLAVGTNFT